MRIRNGQEILREPIHQSSHHQCTLYFMTRMVSSGRQCESIRGNTIPNYKCGILCKTVWLIPIGYNLTCVQIRAAKSENCVNCKGTAWTPPESADWLLLLALTTSPEKTATHTAQQIHLYSNWLKQSGQVAVQNMKVPHGMVQCTSLFLLQPAPLDCITKWPPVKFGDKAWAKRPTTVW